MRSNSFLKSLFFSAVVLTVTSQAFAQKAMTAQKWQEDLRYLENVITAERSNLFHLVTQEEFEAAVKELHDKIPTLQRHEIIVGFARVVPE